MVSIIVCSYNRGHFISELLRSINDQEPPAGHEVEVIIVDNNSTDGTQGIVETAASHSRYRIRLVTETSQGASYARNRGIREARGEWLAFLDDDSVPRPYWLKNLVEGAEKLSCKIAGGPVHAIWPDSVPFWIAKTGRYRLAPLFCHTDLGSLSFRFPQGEWDLAGPNMMFHRSIPESDLYFNTDVGPGRSGTVGGEEPELMERLAAKVPVAYLADAVVGHPVDPRRFGFRNAMRYMYRCGYSGGIVQASRDSGTSFSSWRFLARRITWFGRDFLVAAVTGRLSGMFWALGLLSSAFGRCAAHRNVISGAYILTKQDLDASSPAEASATSGRLAM